MTERRPTLDRDSDDARAHRALEAWHRLAPDPAPFASIGRCGRCRTYTLLADDNRCTACHDDERWASLNRAMCDLVHRGAA